MCFFAIEMTRRRFASTISLPAFPMMASARFSCQNLQEEGERDDDITIRQRAFARAGLEPSAHVPARRENGRPSVGCRCARAPGTARRAAHAAEPAALRALARWPPRRWQDRKG